MEDNKHYGKQRTDTDSISMKSSNGPYMGPQQPVMNNYIGGNPNDPHGNNIYNKDQNSHGTTSRDSGIYHLTSLKRTNTGPQDSLYQNPSQNNLQNDPNYNKESVFGSQNSLVNGTKSYSGYSNPGKMGGEKTTGNTSTGGQNYQRQGTASTTPENKGESTPTSKASGIFNGGQLGLNTVGLGAMNTSNPAMQLRPNVDKSYNGT